MLLTYLCKVHDIKLHMLPISPPMLGACLWPWLPQLTTGAGEHSCHGEGVYLSLRSGISDRISSNMCDSWYYVPIDKWIIITYNYDLHDSSGKVMWLPTQNTKIVDLGDVLCDVGEGFWNVLKVFPQKSFEIHQCSHLTVLCHTYTCKSLHFSLWLCLCPLG